MLFLGLDKRFIDCHPYPPVGGVRCAAATGERGLQLILKFGAALLRLSLIISACTRIGF